MQGPNKKLLCQLSMLERKMAQGKALLPLETHLSCSPLLLGFFSVLVKIICKASKCLPWIFGLLVLYVSHFTHLHVNLVWILSPFVNKVVQDDICINIRNICVEALCNLLIYFFVDGYFWSTETNIPKIVKMSPSTIQVKLQSHDTCMHIRNICLETLCNLLIYLWMALSDELKTNFSKIVKIIFSTIQVKLQNHKWETIIPNHFVHRWTKNSYQINI